jgi:cobalt-zinc-cadmium efflux system membrane fusion protein
MPEKLIKRGPLPRPVQILVVAIGAGVLVVYLLFSSLFHHAAAPPAEQAQTSDQFKPSDRQLAALGKAPVRLAPFSSVQVTDGKIAIDDDLTTPVFSPYSGRVTQVFARAGAQVKAGDPLVAVQAAEFVQAANDLVAAIASTRTTKAQLALAGTTEKRQHDLYLVQGGALKDWQQSQSDLENARGAFNTAQVALGAVRNRLRILGMSESQEAAMEKANDPTRFNPETVVTAPIGGTITQRAVGLGQNIVSQGNGGSTAVFTIADSSRVWLVGNVREVDAPEIHLGDEVEVRALAFPDRVFKATVTFVAASIDPTSHRLPIHAEVANPDGMLKPEMFASFRIITSTPTEAPAVPDEAIVYDPEGAHVWVVGPDKTLSLRKVKLGRSGDGTREVLDGLKPGEVVVTSGSVFIDRAAAAD